MSTGYQIVEQNGLHYVTFQIVKWVDLFTRQIYRDIVIDSLRYCQQNKGLEIYAFVIMSNHVHLLLRSHVGRLSDTIGDFKSFTAKEILSSIASEPESRKDWMLNLFEFSAKQHKRNEKYQIWTHENHSEYIFSDKFLFQKINYIHENPVRAGLVAKAEDYLYLSASAYAGLPCLLNVLVQYMPVETVSASKSIRTENEYGK